MGICLNVVLVLLVWEIANPLTVGASPFVLTLNENGLTASQAQEAQKLLDEATVLLPSLMKETIGRPITVSFDFSDKNAKDFEIPCGDSQGPIRLGHERESASRLTNEIVINGGFLARLSQPLACGHGSYFRQAVATMIHEVAHIYDHDFTAPLTAQELKEIEVCYAYASLKSATCAYAMGTQRDIKRVSSHRQFLELAGWDSLELTRKNQLPERAPDPYVLKDPEEAFAVWMEYFLLDPEMSCRSPAIYRYFSERFSVTPHRNPDGSPVCTPNQVVYSSRARRPLRLDPSRIYQIHYLYANSGNEAASRWGHAMLRLVVCDPKRTEVGPDCLKDVSSHIIASYRANVFDIVPSLWKGLFGDYPSNIFFFTFPEVFEEYTQNELRDLISIPLRFSPRQKTRLLEFLLEQYWTYDGRYYFLNNNCATETAKAIEIALGNPSMLSFGPKVVVEPTKLMEQLVSIKLGDGSVLNDQKKAIEMGYLFQSELQTRLKKAFENARSILGGRYGSVEEFLEQSRAKERSDLLKSAEVRLSTDRRLVLSLLFLELQVQRQNEVRLQTGATELFVDGDSDLFRQYQTLQKLKLPWKQLVANAGYGVPLESELSVGTLEAAQKGKMDELAQLAEEEAQRKLPELFSEKNAILENITFLIQKSKGN